MSDAFTQYVETALWSTLDWTRDSDGNLVAEGDSPPHNCNLDKTYSIHDLSPALAADMRRELDEFMAANDADISVFCERLGFDDEQVAHDFWLTREGHGAGFWDRYSGSDAELSAAIRRLSESARAYGNYSDSFNPNGETLEHAYHG